MRRAYHRIKLRDGNVVEGPVVVETDENGSLVSWHPLLKEEPLTEWVGGCYND